MLSELSDWITFLGELELGKVVRARVGSGCELELGRVVRVGLGRVVS